MNTAEKVQKIQSYLESRGLEIRKIDSDFIVADCSVKDGAEINIYFDFSGREEGVAIQALGLVEIPFEKVEDAEKTLEKFNGAFGDAVITVDDDEDSGTAAEISIYLEEPVKDESCGEDCYDLLLGVLNIAEEIYPDIMEATGGESFGGDDPEE